MGSVPLHTRAITLRLRWGHSGELLCEGRLLDIRKRSIVPLGASLRGPGVVHDMTIAIRIDPRERVILGVDPVMRTFPYVASEYTEGEACDGRVADVQSVVGAKLDALYPDHVRSLIGGPLGCFHIFVLLRVAGPAVVAALRSDYVRSRLSEASSATEREILWARCATIDAFKGDGLAVQLHGTLTDTFQRGGPPEGGAGSEELVSGYEVMADIASGFPEMNVEQASGRRRELLPGYGRTGSWESNEEIAGLHGLNIRKGFTAGVNKALGDLEGLRPESQLIYMMSPVLMQSLPGLLEEMEISSGGRGSGAPSAALNSCHMWRENGPLDRTARGERNN